jgi:alanine-glyoxylate transaminase / serine-glyoxylate transaminase / serine-pyruvate transaminase
MHKLLENIDEILLMGPGPSCIAPSVYSALSKPTLGHMDSDFINIMDAIKENLRVLFQTENRLTVPMSGTGSAGMETCFVNLIETGDNVLILINGVFAQRMADVASRLGANVDTVEFEWGTPVLADQVKAKLNEKDYRILGMIHAETSTGVCNPAEQISQLLAGSDTLFILDTVTSLGGIPVKIDEWGVDAVYSGSQKCLSCPPGLSPVSFSERAIQKLQNRKNKVPNWYLDLSMIINYWEGKKRAYHHTAPVNMLYGLCEALNLIMEEGMDHVFERHRKNHEALVKGIEALGLSMLVRADARLPMLNAITIPDGADDERVRTTLRKEYKIEIGAGLGPLAGKIWRIGLMGHTAREENVEKFLNALGKTL